MNCSHCGKEIPAGLAFCSECGTPIVKEIKTTGGGTRDEVESNNLVYPHNPPLSPYLALLSIFPGVAQIVYGQTLKGLAMLVAALIGVPTGILAIGIMAISVIDAYMVGTALYKGQPVEKWQFFPKSGG